MKRLLLTSLFVLVSTANAQTVDLTGVVAPKDAPQAKDCVVTQQVLAGFVQLACNEGAVQIMVSLRQPAPTMVGVIHHTGDGIDGWHDVTFPTTGALSGDYIKVKTLEKMNLLTKLGMEIVIGIRPKAMDI